MFSPKLEIDAYTYVTRSPTANTGYVKDGKFVEQAKRGEYRYYEYMYKSSGYEWNGLGSIPLVRSVSGSIRAFLGMLDVVTGLALTIISQNTQKLDIASIGARNIAFGALEVGSDVLMISSLFCAVILGITSVPGLVSGLAFAVSLAALPMYYSSIYNSNKPDPTQKIIYET